MNYRRLLLLTDLEAGALDAVDLVRRVAPDADLLLIVARVATSRIAWFSPSAPADLNAAATEALETLQRAASGAARSVEVRVQADSGPADLADVSEAAGIDLVVAHSLHELSELRRRRALPGLWAAPGPVRRPIETILCVALGQRARRAGGQFLRDHCGSGARVTALLNRSVDVESALQVAGVRAHVERATRPPRRQFDLVVVAHAAAALLAARMWQAPVLLLPPSKSSRPAKPRAMDLADAVDENGALRLRAHYARGVGRHEPIPDQALAIVAQGRLIATVDCDHGSAELIPAPPADALGIYRTEVRAGADPLASVEQQVSVIRPSSRPLLLVDSRATEGELRLLSRVAGIDVLAVRMRVTESCGAVRNRLRKAGLAPRVADAGAVLDEGTALDVGDDLDAVRLARVATRMRAAGFPIAAIVHRGARDPSAIGFAALRAEQVTPHLTVASPGTQDPPPGRGLEAATGAALIAGNRIEVELDNARARRWLLQAIAAARRCVHLQAYMALDDDVGSAVEAALAQAGARGVTVRVVVDSLHGLHGSLGARNPLLQRLGSRAGVDLRVLDPITSPPSLHDLKQRDHRKLAVIDGEVALLGGRNLSHEYYTGFDEVRLTSRSQWREVPWLDGGALVQGPAVAALERSFLEAWTAAGGSPFEINERPPAGTAAARVIVHHGLRDARTLDAYVALIDGARSHVYAVNGFPLILEIQHALRRALRRGVRVRTVFGNLTPTHGGTPFEGPWSAARTEATQLVHSRMDELVAMGAEAYEFAVAEQKAWERGLGAIHPHVHAKVLSVDARVCSVGSANLDITAGYWENELLLVVEDTPVAAGLESEIDRLLTHSRPVDRDDPQWQKLARRRDWMRRWPGVMSI